MKKIDYIPQISSTECGLCCVLMILNYYGVNESIDELRRNNSINRDGMSIKQISEIIKHYGLDTKIYKCSVESILKNKQKLMPAIIFWNNSHFVILERIYKKEVQIIDPLLGEFLISIEDFESSFSNIILVSSPTRNLIKLKKKKIDIFKKYYRKSILLILLLLIVSMLTNFISILIPNILGLIIDEISNIELKRVIFCLLIVFSYLIFMICKGLVNSILKFKIYRYFSKDVNKKILNSKYDYFEFRNKSLILYNIDCVEHLNEKYGQKSINIVINILMIITLLIYCSILHFYSVLFILLELFVMGIIIWFINNKIAWLNKKELDVTQKTRDKQYDIINLIQSVKISGLENRYYCDWKKIFDESIDKKRKKDLFISFRNSFNGVVHFIFPLIIVFISFLFSENLSFGLVMRLYSISGLIISYSYESLNNIFQLKQKKDYYFRVLDLISQEQENSGQENLAEINSIEFKNVNFNYAIKSSLVLRDINFKISKGEKIAIVGKSGSGKSSIAKLIIKLYDLTSGDILINNKSIKTYSNHSIREKICFINQESVLVNKTILENIKIINNHASLEEVISICKKVYIYNDIINMPMQFNTLLSNDFNVLSGGQKQKIILARALLSNSDVYIFDEATNSIDELTEEKIINMLLEMNKTIIFITHKLSSLHKFDRTIVIKEGVIIEEGKKDELLLRGGELNDLFSKYN